ncbi:MAG: sulfotransferase [Nitrospirae bacterium]|nr:sulfotransferase [Nitrospirota bacterium]
MKPLFIFSLPRSGSTLLQRVLAADSRISSAAEPWLLLPFVYALRAHGVKAVYSHQWANFALNDFIGELPNGKQDYLLAIGSAVNELYEKAAKNKDARYFLDKTPRYALIIDEIIDMFPNGKFIFLWRNPLAVLASIVETWAGGKWDLSMCKVDLYLGIGNLIAGYQAHSEQILAIQYESFLQSPGIELARMSEYLELRFDPDVLKQFSQVSFKGKLGDPTGTKNYRTLDTAPLEKWKSIINNPLRKMWCRRYLWSLGEERLKVMGYDLKALLHELDSTGMTLSNVFSDIVSMIKPTSKPELPSNGHF